MDNEREVHRRRVHAVVEEAFCHIESGDAGFFFVMFQRHDEFMHADARIGDIHVRRELVHEVVRIQHRLTGGFGEAIATEHQDIGQRTNHDEEIAVEHLHLSKRMSESFQMVALSFFHHDRRRQEVFQEIFASHRAAPRAAAAMRGRKGLVQIQMHTVESHIPRTRTSDDGIEVRPIVVAKAARFVDDAGDFQNIRIENAERIRIREHKARGILADRFFQLFQIDAAFCI